MLFLICLALSVPLALLEGFVFMKLWGWFVVAQFGLPELNIASAVGIATFMQFLAYQVPNQTQEDANDQVKRFFALRAASAIVALFFGWIAYQFV